MRTKEAAGDGWQSFDVVASTRTGAVSGAWRCALVASPASRLVDVDHADRGESRRVEPLSLPDKPPNLGLWERFGLLIPIIGVVVLTMPVVGGLRCPAEARPSSVVRNSRYA